MDSFRIRRGLKPERIGRSVLPGKDYLSVASKQRLSLPKIPSSSTIKSAAKTVLLSSSGTREIFLGVQAADWLYDHRERAKEYVSCLGSGDFEKLRSMLTEDLGELVRTNKGNMATFIVNRILPSEAKPIADAVVSAAAQRLPVGGTTDSDHGSNYADAGAYPKPHKPRRRRYPPERKVKMI